MQELSDTLSSQKSHLGDDRVEVDVLQQEHVSLESSAKVSGANKPSLDEGTTLSFEPSLCSQDLGGAPARYFRGPFE